MSTAVVDISLKHGKPLVSSRIDQRVRTRGAILYPSALTHRSPPFCTCAGDSASILLPFDLSINFEMSCAFGNP